MMPAGFTPTDTSFGAAIVLAGTSVVPAEPGPGDAIEVGLAWRTTAAIETSYRVFVHLLGPDGVVVAQSDGVPADWSRPTTGWAAGEVVAEVRTVGLPVDAAAGSYALRVGLYDDTGTRLMTPDGADSAVIATFEVVR